MIPKRPKPLPVHSKHMSKKDYLDQIDVWRLLAKQHRGDEYGSYFARLVQQAEKIDPEWGPEYEEQVEHPNGVPP